MAGEKLYTLEEACRIILLEICALDGGHNLDQAITRGADGSATVIQILCTRCGTVFVPDPTQRAVIQ